MTIPSHNNCWTKHSDSFVTSAQTTCKQYSQNISSILLYIKKKNTRIYPKNYAPPTPWNLQALLINNRIVYRPNQDECPGYEYYNVMTTNRWQDDKGKGSPSASPWPCKFCLILFGIKNLMYGKSNLKSFYKISRLCASN